MDRMLPGTRALRTFEAAGRHLNFTRAADEVGLTPAAVSRQIKDIEDQLGIALFVRTSRSIRLTPAGAVLFDATVEALDVLRRATAQARGLTREGAHLRVSLSARFATGWLLPRLPRFRASHPSLELTFDISDDIRDFVGDDIDVAIRFGNGVHDDARSVRLFDTVVAPVCSPRLREADPRFAEPRDLARHALYYLDWSTESFVWPTWKAWMAAAGIDDFDDRRCVAFSDTSHVVQAAIAGGGVGLADVGMIAAELAEGRLVRPFQIGVRIEQAYHLVYPERRDDDPRIQAFRAWMLAEVAGAPQER